MLTLLLALGCAPDKPADDTGPADTDTDTCTFYADNDGDGWGDLADAFEGDCAAAPAGRTAEPGDCDDGDATVHPDADERCNEADDDCDGAVDDTPVDALVGYPDADGDGFGATGVVVTACALPAGHLEVGGDCDDADAAVHPGVEDLDCDNVDDDCDGAVDGGWRVPEDQRDLQVAIDSAPEGSTLCVGPGTYVTGLDFGGRAQRVVGREGPDVTILDAAAAFSAVTFASGEGEDTILEGFTIRNGRAAQGAGVYVRDASPTLRDLVITGNGCEDASSAGRCEGAGVWISGGAPVFEDVVVRGNTQHAAVSQGAGVYVAAGAPVFTRVEVADNTQEGVAGTSFLQGAGLFVAASTPALEDVTVSGNTQTYDGSGACSIDGAGVYASGVEGAWGGLVVSHNAQVCGGSGCNASGAGLYLFSEVVLTLDGARITDNTAVSTATSPSGYGAGVSAYAGVALTLRDAVVSGNRLHTGSGLAQGGGLYGRSDVTFTFENTLLAGNVAESAWSEGGAISLQEYADATLTNSILAGNEVTGAGTGRGAGIFARNDTVTLTQVDVVGNTCTSSVCNGVAFNLYTDVRLTFDGVNVVGNRGTSGRTSGGAIHEEFEGSVFTAVWSNLYDNESTELYGVAISAADGNVFVDPGYADTSAADPAEWDLTLAAESPVRDAGNPDASDPDGSRAAIGAWGGAGAAGW
jgi:hypothetical protein